MIVREKLIQWLLDCGTGIVYNSDGAETTAEEIQSNDKPRYVLSEYADNLMNGARQVQVEYAIEKNMSLVYFDEWQAIQNVLFMSTINPKDTIPFEIAQKINDALWEVDISPLDLEAAEPANDNNETSGEKECTESSQTVKKKIWLRVGMEAELTEEEYAELIDTKINWDFRKMCAIFEKIIDKAELSGESYIPASDNVGVEGYDNPDEEIDVLF